MSYNYNEGPQQGYMPPPGPYPPPQGAGYPPPQGAGYPPPQGAGYPPPQGAGYPPPQGGYQPAGGYPTAPQPGFQYGGGQMGGDPYQAPAGEGFPLNSNTTAHGGYGAYSNPEDPEVKGFDFSDASIRRGFIRKVYSILMVQLSISLAFIALFVYHKPTRDYVQHSITLFIVAVVLMLVSMFTLVCCGEVRRKAPMNFIVLFLFTLAESFLLGITASRYAPTEVMMAVGITAAVCLALTLFAFQTKYDFTMMGGILVVAVVILLIFGIVAMFVHNKIVSLVYASLGALIFSIYLVYDTQLMMGGSHKYSISPEEYVFAALNLYLDIVNIFIYILQIIGHSKD